MTLDEKQLARRFCAGEAGSFETLYREYGPRIYRFCLRLCGDITRAEDLTQDVFLAAYRGAERFEGRASLSTWLYRIALYRWNDLKSRDRLPTVALSETRDVLLSDPAQAGLERVTLESALAALPEPIREAFLLVKGEGFRCREAAEILRIPEGTLKSRVAQAVRQLQHLLATEESASHSQQAGKGWLPGEILP